MRISSQLQIKAALDRLAGRQVGLEQARSQVASGRRINKPSDDITGTSRAMALKSGLRTREQEVRNADDGLLWINMADSKLQAVSDRLHRVRELAVAGATTTSALEGQAAADELAGIRAELVELANAKSRGRSLFAGHIAGDAVAKVGGVWTYTGDSGEVNRRVAESELVAINVTADDVFGFNSGTDIFTVLDSLEAAFVAGDTVGADAGLAAIDGALDNVLSGLARLGAAANHLESAETRRNADVVTITSQLSQIEDIDLAEAIMELQLQEVGYQAALQSYQSQFQPSLVDFLR